MQKGQALYTGKAKTLFECEDPNYLICHFRNDTSAFDGVKKESLKGKGVVNNLVNAYLMERLEQQGIATHFVERLSDEDSLVKKLEMLPVECVVRNRAAGSLCRRLGTPEGIELRTPLFEFFLKNDELHDPLINDDHIRLFNWATDAEIELMRLTTLKINDLLKKRFDAIGLILVDFKIEFGRHKGSLVLGDEITPDGCRLWDKETGKSLDKDRFRKDLGDVVESYEEVAKRLMA